MKLLINRYFKFHSLPDLLSYLYITHALYIGIINTNAHMYYIIICIIHIIVIEICKIYYITYIILSQEEYLFIKDLYAPSMTFL